MGKRGKRRKAQLKREMEAQKNTINTALQTTHTQTNQVGFQRACHRGPVEVMQIGNVRVWAGAFREVQGDFDWDIILRLSDGEFTLNHSTEMFNKQAKEVFPDELNVNKFNPAIIDMRWSDYGRPYGISHEWWKLFNQRLLELPPSIMLVHCLGGHGRTGTALSILAGLNNLHSTHPKNDPVEYVRSRYCDNAVESHEQLRYIEAVTGVEVHTDAGHWRGFGFMQGYHGHSHAGNGMPTTTTGGYVHSLAEPKTYDSWQGDEWEKDQAEQMPAGAAYTCKLSDLKGEIEAKWTDDGKDYIFADDKVFQVMNGDILLELDWTSGSYAGTSEHRMRTGGM